MFYSTCMLSCLMSCMQTSNCRHYLDLHNYEEVKATQEWENDRAWEDKVAREHSRAQLPNSRADGSTPLNVEMTACDVGSAK
jgi:hypothetical protein